jgi:hypothetical protein
MTTSLSLSCSVARAQGQMKSLGLSNIFPSHNLTALQVQGELMSPSEYTIFTVVASFQ